MKVLAIAAIVLSLAACATNPDKVASAYIPSSEYADDSCQRLSFEYGSNNTDAQNLYRSMKTKSRVNATAGVVGAVLFWPALFFMKGKDAGADAKMAEYKGRETAILKAMNQKGC